MAINAPMLLSQLTAQGLGSVPLRISDSQVDCLDPTTPQTDRDQIAAIVAAHNPEDPDQVAAYASVQQQADLTAAMQAPAIQAVLGVIAQQQGTTVDAIQAQAVAAKKAEDSRKERG